MGTRAVFGFVALAAASFGVTRAIALRASHQTGSALSNSGSAQRSAAQSRVIHSGDADERIAVALRALAALAAADGGSAMEQGEPLPIPETLSSLQDIVAHHTQPELRRAAWRLRTDLTMTLERRIARCWARGPERPVQLEITSRVQNVGSDVLASHVSIVKVISGEPPTPAEQACIDQELRGAHVLPKPEALLAALGSISSDETVLVHAP